uniref:Uncharacterized protein n=1 Tax=Polynucleobacter necessarius subsp. necessarius (strain STIR1) TaxID=452638 RepID=B1XVG3_POLNS
MTEGIKASLAVIVAYAACAYATKREVFNGDVQKCVVDSNAAGAGFA